MGDTVSDGPAAAGRAEHLPALTALRFFAAFFIVLHHAAGTFGVPETINQYLATYQAVSFFFVLSGFILTYVYGSFASLRSAAVFYRARMARIWPVHLFTLGLIILFFKGYFVSVYGKGRPGLAAAPEFWANVFLVQAWIPERSYFWGFNSVSWSISTEMAFYLLFPLLLYRFKETWRLKLLATLLLSIGMLALCNYVDLPFGLDGGIGCLGLLNIHPLTRIVEFTLGMSVAIGYQRLKNYWQPGPLTASMLETMSICAVLAGMAANTFLKDVAERVFGMAGRYWVDSGTLVAPLFGLCILVMAMGRGGISRRLGKSHWVLLGEISFAMYLLHQIALRVYQAYLMPLFPAPGWMGALYFWSFLFIASYTVWFWVEQPGRRGLLRIGTAGREKPIWSQALRRSFGRQCLVCVLLMGMPLFAWYITAAPVNRVVSAPAETDTGSPLFGDRFALLDAGIEPDGSAFRLSLTWKSLKWQKLRFRVAVHLVDASGTILSQADYDPVPAAASKVWVRNGDIWEDRITLSPEQIQAAVGVGLAIFSVNDMKLMPVSAGNRDYGSGRLRLPLEHLFHKQTS